MILTQFLSSAALLVLFGPAEEAQSSNSPTLTSSKTRTLYCHSLLGLTGMAWNCISSRASFQRRSDILPTLFEYVVACFQGLLLM